MILMFLANLSAQQIPAQIGGQEGLKDSIVKISKAIKEGGLDSLGIKDKESAKQELTALYDRYKAQYLKDEADAELDSVVEEALQQ